MSDIQFHQVEHIPRHVKKRGGKRGGKWQRLIKEFLDSGYQLAELELDDPSWCKTQALCRAARRSGYPVKVVRRAEKVFIKRVEEE